MGFALLAAVTALVAAVVWGAIRTTAAVRQLRDDGVRQRSLQLLALLAPARGAAREDPKALLAWQPVASLARQLFPVESAALDVACGGVFPFGREEAQAAHARWTSAWLAWEAAHDAEYRAKSARLEDELAAGGVAARAGLEALGREKLARYQQQYEEYTRVSKALRVLAEEVKSTQRSAES
jgi:hypothetical protein